jgi:hypothetical protein
MGLNCGCPVGASLESLTDQQCKSSFGQIQKLLIQRRLGAQGALNTIAAADIVKLTKWTGLIGASDSTKVVVSPELSNPETEPGAARTFGGDNQTPGGVQIIVGREATQFTGAFYELDQSVIKVMKSYQCEDVAVYFVDEYGNIGCVSHGSGNDLAYSGVPIQSLFIGDKDFGGLTDPDSNAISFNMKPNWSDDFVIIKQSGMDFNPLTDLNNSL